MKKLSILTLVVAFMLVFSVNKSEALFDVGVKYWFSELDSELQVTEAAILGDTIDLTKEIGLPSKENFLEFRVVAGLGSHKLRYIFLPMSWKGSSDIQRNIVFGGETYTVGSTVSGDLTIDYHRLGYEYDIIDTLDNKLGIIFEVKYLDIVGSLQEPLIPLDEKGEIALPIPTVGLTFQIGLPSFFTVGAEVTGMSAGQYGRIIDAEAAINFAPVPFFRLSGGYKILNVHGEYQDNVVDLSIKGPFAMLRFKF